MAPAAGIGGKGGTVVGVLWAENAICYVLIGLRLYTRRYIRGSIGWDDLCLVATSVSAYQMSYFAQATNLRPGSYDPLRYLDHSLSLPRHGSTLWRS